VAALAATFPTTLVACNGGAGLLLGPFGCADRSAATDESAITTHLVSTELRAMSDFDGSLNFTAGAIYSYNWTSTDYFVFFTGAETLARIQLALNPAYDMELAHFNNETDPAITHSFGLFGELYWDLTQQTKVTAGGRYIYDKKEADSRNYLLTPDPTTGGLPPLAHQEASWHNGTIRLTLDHNLEIDFSDDSIVFGSVSRGFKPGGFNPPAATGVGSPVSDTFDPETVWAFEAGTKNEFWSNRIRANLTGFFYLYEGYQIPSIVNRTAVNENIDADVWGIEFEYSLIPIDHFEITGSIGYLGSSIKDSFVVDTSDPTAGDPNFVAMKNLTNASNFICDLTQSACNPNNPVAVNDFGAGIPKNLDGRSLPNSPDVQIFVQGKYTFELPWEANLIPRISYYWQNEMYGRIFNETRDEIPSWSEASAGLRYEDVSGRFMIQNWYIDFWIKNFLDENFVTGHYFTDASSGNFTNVFLLDPRTIGFTIGASF
jgi:outer membrane receptor protein involved in Fe transport